MQTLKTHTMSRTIYSKVVLEGFGSFQKETEFNLDRAGSMVLVRGDNGEGKTTMFSGLMWSLHGIPMKDIKGSSVATWEQVRTEDFRGVRVATHFRKNGYKFEVIRHLKFKGKTYGVTGGDTLMFFKCLESETMSDTHRISDNRHKPDVQKDIVELLETDYTQTIHSMFFGQGMARLVNSSKSDKIKLFDELFDATWLKNSKDEAKVKKLKIESDISTTEERIHSTNSKKKDKANQIEQHLINLQEFTDKKEIKHNKISKIIVNKTSELDTCREELKLLRESVDNYDDNLLEEKRELYAEASQDKSLDADLGVAKKAEAEYKTKVEKLEIKLQSEKLEVKTIETAEWGKLQKLKDANSEDLEVLKTAGEKARDEVEETSLEIHNTQMRLKKLTSNISTAEDSVKKSEGKIKNLLSDIDCIRKDCPTCEQELPVHTIKETKARLRAQIKEEEECMQVMTTQIEKYNKEQATLKTTSKQEAESMESLEKNLEETKTNYIKTKADNVAQEELQLQQYNTLYNKQYNIMEAAKTALDDLGRTEGKKIKNLLHELDKKYTLRDNLLSNLRTEIAEIENTNKISIENKNRIPVKQLEIKNLQDYISEKKEDLNIVLEENPPTNNVDELQKDIDTLQELEKEQQDEITILRKQLEIVKWWFTTGFGAKGIKSYIFTAGLMRLNQAIQKYAERLGYRVKFEIDHSTANKDFTTTVFYSRRTETGVQEFAKDYEEFSGGQKQRVSLAIAFAMFDIGSEKSESNIMILDEAFEGLDEEGREAAFDLIRMKTQAGKTVFIITHSQNIDSKYSKSIRVYRKNEISYIDEG